MSTIGGWIGSGTGVVVVGLCVIISLFMHRLPGVTHPWLKRLLIVLMYGGGAALAVTTIGGYALDALHWVGGLIGGTSAGLGWAVVVIVATFLAATVLVGLIWAPDWVTAIEAAVLPLVLALIPGGILAQAYTATAFPAQQLTESIAHGLGG